MNETHKDLPVFKFKKLETWLEWLGQNHQDYKTGIWIKFAKKGAPETTIAYEDAREGALCYGWIDSTPNKLDEYFYLLKFTPRRPKSVWSKINRELCEQYILDGRMQPSGLIQVEMAKQDGRWDKAYESQSNMVVPEDFLALLNKNPKAKQNFENASRSNQFAFIYQINDAKRQETRLRRMDKFINMLERGEMLN